MKKKTVRCIILAAVLLLIVSVCGFGVYIYKKNADDAAAKKNGVIFQFSPENIKGIDITNGNYSYSLEKDDGIWYLKDEEDKKLVQESVAEAVAVFSSISGSEVKNPPELVFGIKVEIDTGLKDTVFYLAQGDSGYYLKTKSDDVYSVSQVVYEVAVRDAGYYRDKTVSPIKSFGPEGENKFVSYNYQYINKDGEKREINVRLKNEEEVLKYDTASLYMLTAPYLLTVDAVSFESDVLTKIPQITAERFVAVENTNLSLFGLDEASRGTLTVGYDDTSFVLYIGKPAEDISEVYCMLPDSDEVFTVKSRALEFLSYNGFYLADKSIFLYNTDYIRDIKINSGNFNLSVRSDGTNFYIGENPVPKEKVHEFLEELKKIKADSMEYSLPAGSEIMKITLTGSDEEVTEYKVIKTDDGRVIVSENDSIFFKINEEALKAFTDYAKQLEKSKV